MKLFISHTSTDNKIVFKILDILKEYEIENYWVDLEKLSDDSEIRAEINKGLENSDHFLLIWTKNAKGHKWVENEIDAVCSEPHNERFTKIVFKMDDTELRPLDSDLLRRDVPEEKIREQVEDLIDKYSTDFNVRLKILKRKIRQQYENPPKESSQLIIPNFKKFDGYNESISRRFINLADHKIGNISEYILSSIKNRLDYTKSTTTPLLHQELKEDDIPRNFFPVVGDYGSGKSTLCHYVQYTLSEHEDNSEIIPIFIPLGDLPKHDDKMNHLNKDIHDFIIKNYKFNLSIEEFEKMVDEGKFIFILDALDEMSITIDSEIAKLNLEFTKILAAKKNIVFVTSRHTYFSKNMEEKLIADKELLQILDYNKEEINQFIDKKLGKNTEPALEVKKMIWEEGLANLAEKPIFLDVICKHYHELKEHSIINGAVTLQILTEKWMIHGISDVTKYDESIEKQIIEDRKRISEILAITQNEKGRPIGIEDIRDKVSEEFSADPEAIQSRIEQYYKDARDSTFLTLEENNTFKFILKPVMEYFVARRIVDVIKQGDKNQILSYLKEIRTPETYYFIQGIIDAEWAVKPHVLNVLKTKLELKEDDPKYLYLKTQISHQKKLISIIDYYTKNKSEHNLSSMVKILFITNNLHPEPNLENINLENLDLPNSNLIKVNFKKSNLKNAELSNSDLTGGDFTESNLTTSKLKNSNLDGVKIEKTNLEYANLDGVQLKDNIITESDLSHASFVGANLEKVDFTDSDVDGTSFVGANLKNAFFSNAKNIKKAKFGGANLQNASFVNLDLTSTKQFRGANMEGVDFTNTDLREAELNRINLEGAKLKNANLTRTRVIGSNLTEINCKDTRLVSVDFRSTDLSHAHFENANLENADFTYCSINNTDFSVSNLKETNFSEVRGNNVKFVGAKLEQAVFKNAQITNSNFSDAKLNNTKFAGADLTNADFQRSDLTNADFTNAKIEGINLEDAILENCVGLDRR